MSGENYQKDPGSRLEKVLHACHWERVPDRFYFDISRWDSGLWEKGQSRLLVDLVGIFLYQFKDNRWVRTRGLAHYRIFPRKHEIIFIGGSRLDLKTGEWGE